MVANFPIQTLQKQTRMQSVHLFPHIVPVLVLDELGHVLQQEAVHLAAARLSDGIYCDVPANPCSRALHRSPRPTQALQLSTD